MHAVEKQTLLFGANTEYPGSVRVEGPVSALQLDPSLLFLQVRPCPRRQVLQPALGRLFSPSLSLSPLPQKDHFWPPPGLPAPSYLHSGSLGI